MKNISSGNLGQSRRQPENKKNIARLNHNMKLFTLAYETRRYWDELNAKLFLKKLELIKILSSLKPSTKKYKETAEELKKVEILYKDVLLQIDFTYSYSGRGDNPFALEDEWVNRPWDEL
tara:strand:- start:82 stop:441 length:360 start_codon:yes stop_codon:yes gene_type:complete